MAMQYFFEQGSTYDEVYKRLQMQYSGRARVLNKKTFTQRGGFLGLFPREMVEVSGYVSSEPAPSQAPAPTARISDFEDEKKKILANVKTEQTLQQLLTEVQAVKEKLDGKQAPSRENEHPNIAKIRDLLEQNDFTREFSDTLFDRINKEFSLEELKDFDALQSSVIEWIAESIGVYPDQRHAKGRPRIFVLVGPTGVGKTTTIAKLAAVYGFSGSGKDPLKVRMLTIDNYRIAARQQIETYGKIMEIPVACVESPDDLRKQLALSQEADLVLIDTIGKSPKDYLHLAEMKELLEGCGSQAEVHLALSATTKTSDIGEILQQFEPFRYRSVVLTKLDETTRIGNIISVLATRRKAVSFVTNGQVVPQDIERASVPLLMRFLEGFTIPREKLEKAYPEPARSIEGRTHG